MSPYAALASSAATDGREKSWRDFFTATDRPRRRQLRLVTVALALAIGCIDFFAGFELSLLVFYILPVCVGVTVSRPFGVATAFGCVAIWLIGDFAAGARFANHAVTFWNAMFALATYLIVLWMFDRVLTLHREMERRVQQRTAALTQVLAEREQLEKAILEISERERRSIGHDLHDGLGQHLTATALAGEVLADKLRTKQAPEEADVWKIVELIESGIEKTRRLARGLLLAEVPQDGLLTALRELAAETSQQFGIACEFSAPELEPELTGADSATHLCRIAQEAVRNAIRHGRAKRVVITVDTHDGFHLTVRDFGTGLRADGGRGLGLSIMAHRAEILGGQFSIAPAAGGGTVVSCRLPPSSVRHG